MTVRFPPGSERLLTIADVAAMPDELPSGPVHYELEKGKLIVMAPPGASHGYTEGRITFYLILLGDEKGYGTTCSGEVGLVLSRGRRETLYGVDALFVARNRLPLIRSSEGYLVTVPNIVAEVRSKNDSEKRIAKKVETYLDAGVDLVWVLDPLNKVVTSYRKGKKPQTLSAKDSLTANGIIPGFAVPLFKLFID
jgi:Uma2 family endonuclease